MLYDAVALLLSEEGANLLKTHGPAKDFVCDAYAHCKFIAYTAPATALFDAAGLSDKMDDGFVALNGKRDAGVFVKAARALRLWSREPATKAADDPKPKPPGNAKAQRRTS